MAIKTHSKLPDGTIIVTLPLEYINFLDDLETSAENGGYQTKIIFVPEGVEIKTSHFDSYDFGGSCDIWLDLAHSTEDIEMFAEKK